MSINHNPTARTANIPAGYGNMLQGEMAAKAPRRGSDRNNALVCSRLLNDSLPANPFDCKILAVWDDDLLGDRVSPRVQFNRGTAYCDIDRGLNIVPGVKRNGLRNRCIRRECSCGNEYQNCDAECMPIGSV